MLFVAPLHLPFYHHSFFANAADFCLFIQFLLFGCEWYLFLLFKVNYLHYLKATSIWKFVQRHFIASKLNAECGGYLDKIYKILVDIIDLKVGFPLANFFIQSNFFRSKTIKSRMGSYFFTLKKVTSQWEFTKKSLRAKNFASGKPVQSAKLTEAKYCIYHQLTLMPTLLKADFHLYVEYIITYRSYSNDMIG